MTPAAVGCLALSLAGSGLLLARPWMTATVDDPTFLLAGLFVALGLAGAWWPVPAPAPSLRTGHRLTAIWPLDVTSSLSRLTVGVLMLGVAAFGTARLLAGGPSAAPLVGTAVALNTLAAVAEEAFFRRLLYDTLLRWGAVTAVLGSALAFAVVHVTVWGWFVLPLDLAAGLVLSWQRWASGRWAVPAVTHAVANLAAVL